MTTIIHTDVIPLYAEMSVIGVFSPNYYFENTGTATLDLKLILKLVQEIGTPSETETVFQVWSKENVVPNQKFEITGAYLLTMNQKRSILLERNNVDPEELRVEVQVTGGASESDRLDMIKLTITDAVDYSFCSTGNL